MTQTIQIETGIPVYERPKLYPFDDMAVGNSFFAPATEAANKTKIRNASLNYGRVNGCKFTTRSVEENGVSGIRVWRLE